MPQPAKSCLHHQVLSAAAAPRYDRHRHTIAMTSPMKRGDRRSPRRAFAPIVLRSRQEFHSREAQVILAGTLTGPECKETKAVATRPEPRRDSSAEESETVQPALP